MEVRGKVVLQFPVDPVKISDVNVFDLGLGKAYTAKSKCKTSHGSRTARIPEGHT
jgi:hypothetical protein